MAWCLALAFFLGLTTSKQVFADLTPKQIRAQETREALREYASLHRNSGGGVLITPPIGNLSAHTRNTRNYLQKILEYIGKPSMDRKGIHIRVNLYSGFEANAAATRPEPNPKFPHWTTHRFLGVAEDGKPVYEILVFQGILPLLKTEDHVAGLLGHELGHIVLGHVEKADRYAERVRQWYTSQANELDSDFFALSVLKGKYNLDAFYELLLDVIPPSFEPNFYSEFGADHHHPSVRLASVIAKIKQYRNTYPEAAPSPQKPLPGGKLFFHSSARENGQRDFTAYQKAYSEWLEGYLGPRSTPLYLNPSRCWNDMLVAYPGLMEPKLLPQEVAILFKKSIERIQKDSSWNSTEKIGRLFEILIWFGGSHYDFQHTFILGDVFQFLGPKEELALRNAIKAIAFSATDPWKPEEILPSLEKRIRLHQDMDSFRYPARHLLREVLQQPLLAPLFKQLHRTSPKWALLIKDAYHFDSDQGALGLYFALPNAVRTPLPEPDILRLLDEVDRLPISSFYQSEESVVLMGVLLVSLLGKEQNLKIEGVVHERLQNTLERLGADYKQRGKALLERVFSQDPQTLSEEEFKKDYIDVSTILALSAEYLKDRGISVEPSEIGSSIQAMWKWYPAAWKRFISSNQSWDRRTYFRFGNLIDLMFPFLEHGLVRNFWPLEESHSIYTKIITSEVRGTYRPREDAYLRSLSPTELHRLIPLQRKRLLQDEAFISLWVRYTGRTRQEVRTKGLSEAFARRFKSQFTQAEGEKRRFSPGVWALREEVEKYLEHTHDTFHQFYVHLLGDTQVAEKFLAPLTPQEYGNLLDELRLTGFESTVIWRVLVPPNLDKSPITSNPHYKAEALINTLIAFQDKGISLKDWAKIYGQINAVTRLEYDPLSKEQRIALSHFLDKKLAAMPTEHRFNWLRIPELLSLLSPRQASHHLSESFVATLAPNAPFEEKSALFLQWQKKLFLQSQHAQTNEFFEKEVAEKIRLQPGEVTRFFAGTRTFTTTDFAGHIRGFSGMVNRVQTLTVPEQIEFIEYMMGRRNQIPPAITALEKVVLKDSQGEIRFSELILIARDKLLRETTLVRALTVLPFFTGKACLLQKMNGTEWVLNHLLQSISPPNRDLALELAKGILEGEGRDAPMAFAYLYGQQGKENRALTEGEILRGLFYAYGVPGTKYAQYLGYCSEFSALKEILSETQDQATPLSYLEVVRLLETRFPQGLPDGLQVVGIKGSGTVNIGVEYYNPLTGRNEVMTVSREAIETATREDFRRFHNVVQALTSSPEGRKRFGFLLGLDSLVQQSVELEFNRGQVFRNHQALSQILNRRVGGWLVKMVEPYSLENGVIRMQKAQGIPARLVEKHDLATYRSAMAATSQVLTDHLLHTDHQSLGHYADSDFHDGQAFIDPATKTVWLIDPGQAVAIEENEFRLAKQILQILSGTYSLNHALDFINHSELNPTPRTPLLTSEELATILGRPDIADAFIKLIGQVRNNGGEVPLPVVQWVLGMNRQLALNRKMGSAALTSRLFYSFAGTLLKDLATGQPYSCRDALQLAKNFVFGRPSN